MIPNVETYVNYNYEKKSETQTKQSTLMNINRTT